MEIKNILEDNTFTIEKVITITYNLDRIDAEIKSLNESIIPITQRIAELEELKQSFNLEKAKLSTEEIKQ